MLTKAYLEDEEFICNISASMMEDSMEKEMYRKKEEKYGKKVEERHLERKQELELARIEEARRKTENQTKVTESRHKEE
ncbi:hypothetical protein TNCV_3732051 [Trichonephila clavipes]|nr:hypothetical protein TNCV_3732051 [Trichonephila clavipes]